MAPLALRASARRSQLSAHRFLPPESRVPGGRPGYPGHRGERRPARCRPPVLARPRGGPLVVCPAPTRPDDHRIGQPGPRRARPPPRDGSRSHQPPSRRCHARLARPPPVDTARKTGNAGPAYHGQRAAVVGPLPDRTASRRRRRPTPRPARSSAGRARPCLARWRRCCGPLLIRAGTEELLAPDAGLLVACLPK
jgi:hypothetical protein